MFSHLSLFQNAAVSWGCSIQSFSRVVFLCSLRLCESFDVALQQVAVSFRATLRHRLAFSLSFSTFILLLIFYFLTTYSSKDPIVGYSANNIFHLLNICERSSYDVMMPSPPLTDATAKRHSVRCLFNNASLPTALLWWYIRSGDRGVVMYCSISEKCLENYWKAQYVVCARWPGGFM